MAEVGIREGDLLVVDHSRTPRDGDVMVTGSNGAFSLERLTHGAAIPELEIWGDIPGLSTDPSVTCDRLRSRADRRP
jgi:hypothetical protein